MQPLAPHEVLNRALLGLAAVVVLGGLAIAGTWQGLQMTDLLTDPRGLHFNPPIVAPFREIAFSLKGSDR